MQFKVQSEKIEQINADIIAIPIFEEEFLTNKSIQYINEITNGSLSHILNTSEMKGKVGETVYLYISSGLKTSNLLLIGVGKTDKFSTMSIRKFAGTATLIARKKGVESLAMLICSEPYSKQFAQIIAESSLMSLYKMDLYKTEDKVNESLKKIILIAPNEKTEAVESGLQRGEIIGKAINLTRTLVDQPGITLTPTQLAKEAKEVATKFDLGIEILDEHEMKKLGMGALLGVALGSEEEAKLIVLRYSPKEVTKSKETIALVGKGITFDAGGISLKPAEGMEKMKYDMAGGAAVIGAMQAIAQLKPTVNVLGIIPSSENLPSGRAVKPGDILKSMNGKTIEVINTDAEGRLILADALAYAKKLGATRIIDLATLTGAISIALGTTYTGLFTNDSEFANEVLAASQKADEKTWQLPLDSEYKELIKSDIADLKNSGGRPAGSITAAYFLKEFADDTPWVHLDIAGTAWSSESKSFLTQGPTGSGVRTLVELVTNFE